MHSMVVSGQKLVEVHYHDIKLSSQSSVDSIFDPGNGLKYKWDGSQWNQLERTLKTIYPIDLDIGSGTTTVMRDLITFGGSKDFTFVLPKCTYNTISTELLAASAGADPTKLQWKDYSSYDNAGYVYVDKDVPGNNWPNPNPSITPYIYDTEHI